MKVQKFNRYLELEEIPELVNIFLEEGEVRKVARNEFFLHEGQKSDKVAYVAKGGFRHMIEASDGRDRVAGYSFVGDFVMAFPAFHAEGSAVSVQAYKDSTLYIMPLEEIHRRQSWEYRYKVTDIALRDVYGRLLLMHRGTPEERYKSLIGRFPAILNEVSLKEIASFLRMTPETLSRIRRKLL